MCVDTGQLAQSSYPAAERPGIELATFQSLVRRPNLYTTKPHGVTTAILHNDMPINNVTSIGITFV